MKIIKNLSRLSFSLKKIIFQNRPAVLVVTFMAIGYDIFLALGNSDYRTFGTIGLYLLTAKLYKFTSKKTFSICLVLLVLMFFQYLFTGASPPTEKTAVWLFLFLLIGVIQQWKE